MNEFVLCWLIVEHVLILDGFCKWYRLSYFIHPLVLVFCQIFLWATSLASWVSYLALSPVPRICGLMSWIFKWVRGLIILLLSFGGSSGEVGERIVWYEAVEFQDEEQSIVSICGVRALPIDGGLVQVIDEVDCFVEEDRELHIEEEAAIARPTLEQKDAAAAAAASEEGEEEAEEEEGEEEVDGFYEKYRERMRWFDLLNEERACGMRAILSQQLGESNLLMSRDPYNPPSPNYFWTKEAQRKIIRSLESDIEMVYVGQTCLCWEALHHQYGKVEALACSTFVRGAFYDDVARKFQQFQVLMERFIEEESTREKRYWNYVHGRFPLKKLLQVPELPGGAAKNNKGLEGQAIFARESLKIVEKSIRAFLVFLKTDNVYSTTWKFRNLFWVYTQVENPNDLQLLASLKKALQKKELGLKDLQRRNKCWLKRASSMESSQRMEILFSIIEMKLVSRVLKMSVISTHHLKWCQEKISNIEMYDGKVVRSCSSCLFPL